MFTCALLSYGQAEEVKSSSFWAQNVQGWHWYREAKPKTQTKNKPASCAPRDATEGKPFPSLKAWQQHLQAHLEKAVMDPSPQNLLAYQKAQQQVMDHAALFSVRWMRSLLHHPETDPTTRHPVSLYGLQVHQQQTRAQQDQKIQAWGKTYGLFFFVQKDCAYCRALVPVVRQFVEKHGWSVITIQAHATQESPNETLADYPNLRPDNGIVAAWGVTQVPSLYAVNPETQQIMPLAQSLVALDKLEENTVMMLSAYGPQGAAVDLSHKDLKQVGRLTQEDQ